MSDIDQAVFAYEAAFELSKRETGPELIRLLIVAGMSVARHLRSQSAPAAKEPEPREQSDEETALNDAARYTRRGVSDEFDSGRTLYEAWRGGNDPTFDELDAESERKWERASRRAKQVFRLRASRLAEKEGQQLEAFANRAHVIADALGDTSELGNEARKLETLLRRAAEELKAAGR